MKPVLVEAALAAAAVGAAVAASNAEATNAMASALNGPAKSSNLDAFLRLIRVGESSDNYLALVGGGNFNSFDTHPAIGEGFQGIPVSGGLKSYAAGAYQITKTTFLRLCETYGFKDFAPETQDAMAVCLLKERGAYDLIMAGDAAGASRKLSREWEIFTTSRFTPEKVASMFQDYGGFTS